MLKIQPWHVAAWRRVELPIAQRSWILRRLEPMALAGDMVAAWAGNGRGQVTWGCDTPQGPVGLTWEWFAIRPRILALADPMSIVSNLDFVDGDGRPFGEGRRVVELNNVISRLAWQAPIVMAQGADRDALPVPLAA